MYPENPDVETYRKSAWIIQTPNSAAGMRKAFPAMAVLTLKLLKGEKLGTPESDGYIIRKNMFYDKLTAERCVDMFTAKLNGEDFTTEYKMPVFDRVDPQPAVKDIKNAVIALITSGGICPKDDATYPAQDADRLLPVDVLRDIEREGVIGKLHDKFYATVGNAKKFGAEIVNRLVDDGVTAVILIST